MTIRISPRPSPVRPNMLMDLPAREIGPRFLERKIGFLEIAALVAEVVERVSAPVPQSVSDVVEIDRLGRESAAMLLTEMAG